jgi:hypothetical protein
MQQATSEVHAPSARWSVLSSRVVVTLPGLCFALTALTFALAHVGPTGFARFWDDALFFRRVAYNVVHHGSAAWNVVDGPVFVNTSQLFQLIGTGLLALFPHHYNAAITIWSAACIAGAWWFLWKGTRSGAIGALLLFCLWHAPTTFLIIRSGMETATVLLVVSIFLYVTLRGLPLRHRLAWLTALQVLVYVVRPEGLILTMLAGPGLLFLQGKRREAVALVGATLLGVAVVSAVFFAYYGTPVPLATFLKFSPLSVYDQHYFDLGLGVKRIYLTEVALIAASALPLISLRLDRVNLVLSAAAAAFITFHGLFTNEIMGNQARFYAPALPFLFAAAARGLERADAAWKRALVLAGGVAAAVLVALAYRAKLIEGGEGYFGVRPEDYAAFFVGVPLAAGLSFASARVQHWLAPSCVAALTAIQLFFGVPFELGLVTDRESDLATLRTNWMHGGADLIMKCFPEPLRLMHSELGMPGVLFPESTIIDYTGLANRAVANGTWSFEETCETQSPEFIYRPHDSHRRLNQTLSSSACLDQNYTQLVSRRQSLCPLFVRNDLVEAFKACRR